MIDPDEHEAANVLDQATEALRDAAVPPGPPDQLVASTLEAMETLDNAPGAARPGRRRILMLRIARYMIPAAAAIVLIVFMVSSFLVEPDGGAAFADVIKKVTKAKGIHFQMTQKIGRGPSFSARYYIQGKTMRMEIPGMMTMIANFETKKAIQLNPMARTANRWTLDDEAVAMFGKMLVNPIEHFRSLKGEDAQAIGQRIVAARKVDVYRLKKFDIMGMRVDAEKSNDAQLTILVSHDSGLPVRIMIEASSHTEGKSDDWFIFDEFTWDPPMKAELFSLEAPKGYRVIEGPVGPGPTSRPEEPKK